MLDEVYERGFGNDLFEINDKEWKDDEGIKNKARISTLLSYYNQYAYLERVLEERNIIYTLKTSLFVACYKGNHLVVEVLLANGVTTEYDDFFPLHLACHENHVEVVKVLLNDGMDVDFDNYHTIIRL